MARICGKCDMLAKESGHDVLIGYPGGFVELIEVDGGLGDWGHMDDVSLTRCTGISRSVLDNLKSWRSKRCMQHTAARLAREAEWLVRAVGR